MSSSKKKKNGTGKGALKMIEGLIWNGKMATVKRWRIPTMVVKKKMQLLR